ncbi:MAG: exodeoxyribonuclease VII small subunit [Clostridia bacterium]|nr:exodeoxyribonuclease VII small subunit [Clostridia bacterium]
MKQNINFEEAMEKLELEVKKLEGGNMSLDESLESFENAIKLIRVCNDRLSDAERRVRLLIEGTDGIVTDVAFDGTDG